MQHPIQYQYETTRYRYKKTGKIYELVGHAQIRMESKWEPVVVYRAQGGSESFVRFLADFDQKFEAVL